MRPCPVCSDPSYYIVRFPYSIDPNTALVACNRCGHWFVDATSFNVDFFTDYYSSIYETDDAPYSAARLLDLATVISDWGVSRCLDIGGLDGVLAGVLRSRFNIDCAVAGVGSSGPVLETKYPAVVLSHTLEHVYDMESFFALVGSVLDPGGLVFVEVPCHLDIYDYQYDAHWQHLQKFRPFDLVRLFERFGYSVPVSVRIADYREYVVWRVIARSPIEPI